MSLIQVSFLDKIIIPENLAIRLANNTEVSAETFFADIIKQLQKMQLEAQRSQPEGQPKINRSEFNNYLNFKSIQMQSDEAIIKKLRKKLNKKKYQDDEDFNIDTESSGDKVTTMFPVPTPDPASDLNDTTIVFDQEQEDWNTRHITYSNLRLAPENPFVDIRVTYLKVINMRKL